MGNEIERLQYLVKEKDNDMSDLKHKRGLLQNETEEQKVTIQ